MVARFSEINRYWTVIGSEIAHKDFKTPVQAIYRKALRAFVAFWF